MGVRGALHILFGSGMVDILSITVIDGQLENTHSMILLQFSISNVLRMSLGCRFFWSLVTRNLGRCVYFIIFRGN